MKIGSSGGGPGCWFWLWTSAFLLPCSGFGQLLPINLFGSPVSLLFRSNSNAVQLSQTSVSDQLLYLKAEGAVNAESPADSYSVLLATLPLFYNADLSGNNQAPAWNLDPQAQWISTTRAGKGLLFTGALGLDLDVYPDHPDYNIATLSGQAQLNFTNKGINFKASPFLAYKTEFSVPSSFTGYAWVNDAEFGVNFNKIFGTGKGPLEIDFNPGVSQRWIQVDDSQGNFSSSGSSALEAEIPFLYKFSSRLFFILDPTGYLRLYDVNPGPGDQNRVDEALTSPLLFDCTLADQLQLLFLAVYTYQASSTGGPDTTQLNAGLELQRYF